MKTIYLITAVSLATACGVKRQQHTTSNRTTSAALSHERHLVASHRDRLNEVTTKKLHHSRELVAISPVGNFSYHPDSGFSGTASQVVVYRDEARETDSLHRTQGHDSQYTDGQTVVTSAEETGSSSEASTSQYISRFPGWLAIAALLLGLSLLYWFIRHR
ncbi:hypothetical protein [Parapedobacter tibetensis]|uniref:hypothetical protein n=1 Tax=Parapedobacter tibetensis TaxID=2972951 RepID=UPI00214D209C|nr:hypothetical protein [Parapedobacter tibetensis]